MTCIMEKFTYRLPFAKQQMLDSSKLKAFADHNFKVDENGRKFSKWVQKYCGKRRNGSLRAISPFPTVFSKDSFRHQGLFGKGLKSIDYIFFNHRRQRDIVFACLLHVGVIIC